MNALLINCSPVRTGATAEIVRIVEEQLSAGYNVKSICIDDYSFAFCRGCRACHNTAKCVMSDAAVIQSILNEFDSADMIVSVSPSYWADVPGQFKAFIDRCTPWCNTHEPHARIKPGKKGYSIALRTGPNMPECERIIGSIEHFYGHLEIECMGHLGLTSIEYKEDVEPRKQEIVDFCHTILSNDTGQVIERIKQMEILFDSVKSRLDVMEENRYEEDPDLSREIRKLEEYYTSPLWKTDFAADEKGRLPADLKRGVLSEDGIDDILERYKRIKTLDQQNN